MNDSAASVDADRSGTLRLSLDRTSVWQVICGYLDVFRVSTAAATKGRRTHLFRVEPSELCFGLQHHVGAQAPFRFEAVGTGETEVEAYAVDDLVDAFRNHDARRDKIARQVDLWIRRLYGLLVEPSKTRDLSTSALQQNGKAPPHTRLRPEDGVRWTRHPEGRSVLLSDPALPDVTSTWTPVSTDGWIHTGDTVVSVESKPTSDVLDAGDAEAGLHRLHDAVAEATVLDVRLEGQAVQDNLAARIENDETKLRRSLQSLGEVFHTDKTLNVPRRDTDTPMVTACRLVGEAVDVDVVAPPSDDDARRPEVNRLAEASGLRVREIALRGAWWTKDAGPFVARLRDSETPVAVIPDGPGQYRCYNPVTDTWTDVDESFGAEVQPFGHAFYRPFPTHSLSWGDVARFAFQGRGPDLTVIAVTSVLVALLGLAIPLAVGYLMTDVIPSAETNQLIQITVVLLAIAATEACFRITQSFALLRLQGHTEIDVQSALWDRLLSLPLSFFRGRTAGEIADRITSVSRAQQTLSGPGFSSFLSGVLSVFQFGLLFYFSWELALIAVGLVVVLFGIILGANYAQFKFQRSITDLQNRLSGMVLQFFSGIAKLRVAGAEPTAFSLWAEKFGKKRALQFRKRRIANGLVALKRAAPLLIPVAVFSQAAPMIAAGEMQAGNFLAFTTALTTGLMAVMGMQGAIGQLAQVVPVFEKAQFILDAKPERDPSNSPPGRLRGGIELQHVSFRYDPDSPLVINDLSFSVEPGEFVALVGPSGSGKSTVLRLMLGFERPEAGAVFYDDKALDKLDKTALRRQIGVVPQDSHLMPGDVLTNVIGSTGATLDDAWEALGKAELADDVEEMPMGMHTMVGGGTLSGGQVQRLMIARAVVGNPSILFLDEATSALDNRTQSRISKSLNRLNATRIIIAHRLSTIREADRILVIDEGRLVESGTFSELMDADGVFTELAKRQMS